MMNKNKLISLASKLSDAYISAFKDFNDDDLIGYLKETNLYDSIKGSLAKSLDSGELCDKFRKGDYIIIDADSIKSYDEKLIDDFSNVLKDIADEAKVLIDKPGFNLVNYNGLELLVIDSLSPTLVFNKSNSRKFTKTQSEQAVPLLIYVVQDIALIGTEEPKWTSELEGEQVGFKNGTVIQLVSYDAKADPDSLAGHYVNVTDTSNEGDFNTEDILRLRDQGAIQFSYESVTVLQASKHFEAEGIIVMAKQSIVQNLLNKYFQNDDSVISLTTPSKDGKSTLVTVTDMDHQELKDLFTSRSFTTYRDTDKEWKDIVKNFAKDPREDIEKFYRDQVDANQLDMITSELLESRNEPLDVLNGILENYNIDISADNLKKLKIELRASDTRTQADTIKYELYSPNSIYADVFSTKDAAQSFIDKVKSIYGNKGSKSYKDELTQFVGKGPEKHTIGWSAQVIYNNNTIIDLSKFVASTKYQSEPNYDRTLSDIKDSIEAHISTNPDEPKYKLWLGTINHYIDLYGNIGIKECISKMEDHSDDVAEGEVDKFKLFVGSIEFLTKTFAGTTNGELDAVLAIIEDQSDDFDKDRMIGAIIPYLEDHATDRDFIEDMKDIVNASESVSDVTKGITNMFKNNELLVKNQSNKLSYQDLLDEMIKTAYKFIPAGFNKNQFKNSMDAAFDIVTEVISTRKHSMGDISPAEWAEMHPDKLDGGLADGMDLQAIADKYNVSLEYVSERHAEGTKVELEHTTDELIAGEIAMDHLVEDVDYYQKLAVIETQQEIVTYADDSEVESQVEWNEITPATQLQALFEVGYAPGEVVEFLPTDTLEDGYWCKGTIDSVVIEDDSYYYNLVQHCPEDPSRDNVIAVGIPEGRIKQDALTLLQSDSETEARKWVQEFLNWTDNTSIAFNDLLAYAPVTLDKNDIKKALMKLKSVKIENGDVTKIQCHEGESFDGGKISKVLGGGQVEVEYEDGSKKTVSYSETKTQSSKSFYILDKLNRLVDSSEPYTELVNDKDLINLNEDQYLTLMSILDVIRSGKTITGGDIEKLVGGIEFSNNIPDPSKGEVDALRINPRFFAEGIDLLSISEALKEQFDHIKSTVVEEGKLILNTTGLIAIDELQNFLSDHNCVIENEGDDKFIVQFDDIDSGLGNTSSDELKLFENVD